MKLKLLAISIAVAAFCGATVAQSLDLTAKKVVYKRKTPLMEGKETFSVNYPKIRASTPALSKKIERVISFERVFDFSIKEEMGEIQWLEEADYAVEYNNHGAFCVTLTITGSGAYPSTSNKAIVVDIKTGNQVRPADVFVNLTGLAAMVKKTQDKEIAEGIAEIKKDPSLEEPDPASLFRDANFTVKDLSEFSLDENGVVFIYDYGFPHVIQALQPSGSYFFTWKELKPYIKRGGLLARLAR